MKKILLLFSFTILLSSCNNIQKAQAFYLDAVKEYKEQNFEQALLLINKTLYFKPDFYQAKFLKGKILFYSKDYSASIDIFQKLTKIQKENFDCKFWLLRCYIFNSELDKAKIYLKELIRTNTEDWRLYYYRALIAKQQNNFEDYFSSLNTAESFVKDAASLYLDLALIWNELGLADRSSLCYSKAEILKK